MQALLPLTLFRAEPCNTGSNKTINYAIIKKDFRKHEDHLLFSIPCTCIADDNVYIERGCSL
jgi:hypothetical protein